VKLEYLERSIKSNFILTDRSDRSLTGANDGESMWPLYIFCGLARAYGYSWQEIADYLGYFTDEVKDFYQQGKILRLKKIMATINNKRTTESIDNFYIKYRLVRDSVSNLTKPILNEFNIFQK